MFDLLSFASGAVRILPLVAVQQVTTNSAGGVKDSQISKLLSTVFRDATGDTFVVNAKDRLDLFDDHHRNVLRYYRMRHS